jgi:hypothetical protein
MTVPDRLSAHLGSIQPSRRRAPARNAEVRVNSHHDCHDSPSKAQNEVCILLCNWSPRSSNRRSPTLQHTTGHLPPIEIP